jgi:hypothetical protein
VGKAAPTATVVVPTTAAPTTAVAPTAATEVDTKGLTKDKGKETLPIQPVTASNLPVTRIPVRLVVWLPLQATTSEGMVLFLSPLT